VAGQHRERHEPHRDRDPLPPRGETRRQDPLVRLDNLQKRTAALETPPFGRAQPGTG
jgi:hypothetical protein